MKEESYRCKLAKDHLNIAEKLLGKQLSLFQIILMILA